MPKTPLLKVRVQWFLDNPFCVWCDTTENLTVDHIYARCLGGSKDRINWQTLCESCNRKKANIEQQIALERDPDRETRNDIRSRTSRPLNSFTLLELEDSHYRISRITTGKGRTKRLKSLKFIGREINSRYRSFVAEIYND